MPVAADVAALFTVTELTVPVTLGAVSTRGYFDQPNVVGDDATGGQVKQDHHTLGIATDSLGAITSNTSLVRIGARGAAAVLPGDPQYLVTDVLLLDDGELCQLALRKAA